MEYAVVLVVLAIVLGLFMTWGVGANDVANAMGTSVGSGAITVRKAIIIAAIFEFTGAVVAGGHVTSTIRKGIIDASFVPAPEILVYGMLAALLAAGLWLLVASYFGWPVSTTHTIVGSLIGFGVVGLGVDAVDWNQVAGIVASWLVSPLLGALIAFLLAMSVRYFILDTDSPMESAKKAGPVYVFIMGMLIALVTLFKGLTHLDLTLTTMQTLVISVIVGAVVAFVGRTLIQRIEVDPEAERDFHYAGVERIFAPLCVFTACAMAFAHGSNDVANGVGPLAAVVSIATTNEVAQDSPLPLWILLLGGTGIILGLATMGYRVMKTIGTKITELTPSRGFCAELAAASTVVLASRLGLPVSTTHIIVGAVLGVGMARGVAAIDLRVVVGIVTSWIVTLPIGATLAAFFFFFFKGVFG
ncbi:inorganic phosphate transporter [Gaopeijia maritima]|uniref:inorganic phosphate transporter n=1 Tax=Gaopeijia maritima TaxID=3119007 RepID=UPI00324DCE92